MRVRRPGGLWAHPDFLKLWSAQTVSQLGTQITQLALPLAAIIVLDASAFEVAALGAIEFAPFLLFSLPAGAWIDRIRRRPVLVLADVGRAAALVSVPIAYALDVLTIWQLYAVGFAAGTLTVCFDVAYQSYLPSLVDRSQLADGNAKLEISRSGAALAGPSLAGALVDLFTAPVAILADAISYVVSAMFVAAIRREEAEVRREGEPTRLRVEIMEGLRYVLTHPILRPSMAFVAISNFFGSVLFSILLVYAVRELDFEPAEIGVIFALGNVGFLVGAALTTRIAARLGIGPTLVWSAFFVGWPLLLVPLAPQSAAAPFFVVAFAAVSFAGVVYNVTGLSLMQAITPNRLLARMNASRRFVVWGVIPLGSLTGGALAATIGLEPTLWIGAVAGSLGFLPVLFSPIRSLRELPEPE